MFYTYVLECVDTKRDRREYYVGSSEDIDERVIAHKSKSTQTTKSFDKITLVYYEASLNKTDAVKREHQLKTGFGRGYIKKRLEEYIKQSRG